ncbi:MAG: class I SAM-dependent methyltransferase [bacterium]
MRRGKSHQPPEGPRERIEAEPYSVLARYYDEVMDHVNYVEWAKLIHRVAAKHGRKAQRVVDFACGTGTLARHLNDHGYDVIGLDSCSEMIVVARTLVPRRGRTLEFRVNDMRRIPDIGPQEIGVCLYDSVNYLVEPQEVSAFFLGVRKILLRGGLFICDLSTERNSRDHFDGYVVEEQVPGAWYRRETRYDPDERIQHNRFEIYPDDEDVIYLENHRQRVYSIQWIKDRLAERDFNVLAVYHAMTLRPGSEESDRVHIVAEPV